MKKQTGITLIELIIAVAILGIMAAIAVPNFGPMVNNTRLTSSYNTFTGIVATARVEAVNQRVPVTLCATANGTSCETSATPNWGNGYMVWADSNLDSTIDADEVLRHVTPPDGIFIGTGNASFTFVPRGRLSSSLTIRVCNSDGAESAKALVLSVTGLGRLAIDTTNDNIADVNGINITCPT